MGLAVGVLLLFLLHEREPRARGHSLSTLLYRAGYPYDEDGRDEAKAGLREIGSNAVPFLLERLRATDPKWKLWLINTRIGARLPERWAYSTPVGQFQAVNGL